MVGGSLWVRVWFGLGVVLWWQCVQHVGVGRGWVGGGGGLYIALFNPRPGGES